MIIDLHTHSNLSDGSYPPEDLVDAAIDSKVELIALCDHDTTGDDRFLRYAERKGLNAVQGIEVSCAWTGGVCHILGLGIKRGYVPLESMLEKVRVSRDSRNSKIVEKLIDIGIDITLKDLEEISPDGTTGRPHIAGILIEKGYVDSIKEAFDKYLSEGAQAYVDRYHPTPSEAIRLLKEAGATPVLAHPTLLNRSVEELDAILPKLKEAGLWGIEVHTPYTPVDLIWKYIALTDKYNLGVTAGSDFHGYCKPNHFLGQLQDGLKIMSTLSSFRYQIS